MITELLRHRDNFRRVQNGGEIDHLWFVHVAKILPLFLMWYDTEDWKKTSRLTKCVNMVLIVICWFLWVLVGARVVKDYAEIPATRIAESFAIGLGGMVTFSALVRFAVERDEITDLIHVVDAKFFCVPKDKKWWARSKKVYIVEGQILFGAMVLGFLVGGSQLIFMAYTGMLFYDTIIDSEESYTLTWWLQSVYQGWDLAFSGLFFSLKDFIWADMFYHISCLFRVQAETIMELCRDEIIDSEQEYVKLRNALEEILELYKLSTRLRNMVRHYMFIFGATTYIMMAVSGIVILKEYRLGHVEMVAKSIVYPLYVLGIIILWTTLGEEFTSGVDSVQQALYECNWTAAPIRVRKLILLYKVLFIEPIHIEAAPFFILNLEMLCEIVKKTYCFLTVLSDMI